MKLVDTLNTWQTPPEEHLQPLLSSGFHNLTLSEVYDLAVGRFPKSERRLIIWNGFIKFLESIERWGIVGEIWLDGSFFTYKAEPTDIDVVILINRDSVLALDPFSRDQIKAWLCNRSFYKLNHHCDVYYFDSSDESSRKYWKDWYGLCTDRITPKGIPVIGINHE